jgi:secondary thiamine-phosphate synthase enzyme
MRQEAREFEVRTRGRGLYDFTRDVTAWVEGSGIRTGLLTLHVRHTSASLVVQENADPRVRTDMEVFMDRLVPEGEGLYEHNDEGLDDMPSHVKTALTATSLSIPVAGGAPSLGTWQAIYLFEHRRAPHTRRVAAHLIGA